MQCERLIKLIKTWYLHVQNETMAPARMISFIENHVNECHICQADPELQDEIVKITKIILPESMIPKTVCLQHEDSEENELIDEEETDKTDATDDHDGEEEESELNLFDLDDEI